MVNPDILKTKLNSIRDNLLKIRSVLDASDEALKTDDLSRSALERYFQLMVDAAVGINEHIISEEKLAVPDDYFGTFIILGQSGILPTDFSLKIAPSVGLRNQLVHQYEKIDSSAMLSGVRNNIHQYDEYIVFIVKRYGLS